MTAYRIANGGKAEAEGAAESNTPAARLRARLPAVLTEVKWGRLSTQSRDDLLAFLPMALASSHPGLRANQALVLQVLADLGGWCTAEQLRRRLVERGMTDRTRRWQTIESLVAAGRIEAVNGVGDAGGPRSDARGSAPQGVAVSASEVRTTMKSPGKRLP